MITDDALKSLRAVAHAADSCERSWSLPLQGDRAEERVLFFLDLDEAAALQVAGAARALGVSNSLLRDWSAALPGADAIGVALSRDGSSVRLYTQYWQAGLARVRAGERSPFPLYVGFKGLRDGTTRTDIYHCVPIAPPEIYWPPMEATFAAFGLGSLREAFVDLDADTAIFTMTDGAGRRSWLTTVRRATTRRAAFLRWLQPLEAWPDARDMMAAARDGVPVHLAGGVDPKKGDFLTLYLSSTPQRALDRLSSVNAAPTHAP
jgi:hypothetical protein